jgi:hypothetical protein
MKPDTNGNGAAESPVLGMESGGSGGEGHVVDDEQYSHGRRLRAIHNAHDRTIDARNAVEERLTSGRISEYHARRYYRSAVESFILTILPVFEREDIGLKRDYANEVKLGEVVLHPPEDLMQYARANVRSIPPGGGVPEPIHEAVVGLRDVLDLPSPLTQTFAVAIQHGPDDVQVYRRQVSEEIPRDVLDRAVQACAQALDDAEMGLNIGEDSKEAEFDLSFMPEDAFERAKEGVDDASE